MLTNNTSQQHLWLNRLGWTPGPTSRPSTHHRSTVRLTSTHHYRVIRGPIANPDHTLNGV